MLVTDQKQHVTHAVLGGGQSIDFGISSDPAFFQILSSSLYKDSKKAVVRETICNAWDAHIDSGIDKPIHLTLTEGEFVIRDFGKGIPDALIGPIYAVYGGSTKKNDGKQTGGFGLGCKAPFAYTDTFTVTSWNQGTKTVYVMSKSSSEIGGKPAIRPVMSAPTDDSGLEVRIPIQPGDYSRILRLIKEILFFGGIKALVNDRSFDTIDYESAVNGFIQLSIDEDWQRDQRGQSLVKYGNVVYPIDDHAEYTKLLREANRAIDWCNHRYGSNALILLAPADSISVTPSRESLSMQDNTVATVKALLTEFVINLGKTGPLSKTALTERTKEVAAKGDFQEIMHHAYVPFPSEAIDRVTTTVETLAVHRLHAERNSNRAPAEYRALCDNLLVEHKVVPKKSLEGYKQAAMRHKGDEWMRRHFLMRLVTRMGQTKNMKGSRLFIKAPHYYGAVRKFDISRTDLLGDHAREFLTGFIVLSHTSEDYEHRMRKFPELKGFNLKAHLVYQVPRSAKREEEARAFFQRMRCKVIDLTVAHYWEDPNVVTPVSRPRATTKRMAGIPVGNTGLLYDSNGKAKGNDLTLALKEGADRLENPEWVAIFNDTQASAEYCSHPHERRLNGMSGSNTTAFLTLFGKVGGFARNVLQMEGYKKKGAMSLEDYVNFKLKDAFINNEEIKKYVAAGGLHRPKEHILSIINQDDELLAHYGLTRYTLTEEDQMLLDLYRTEFILETTPEHRLSPTAKEAKDALKAIAFEPASILLGEMLEAFNHTEVSRFFAMATIGQSIRKNDAHAPLARQIIINHLK